MKERKSLKDLWSPETIFDKKKQEYKGGKFVRMNEKNCYRIGLIDSVAAAQGDVPDAHLPLQHQQPGRHLPGYPQGQLVARADHLQGVALHLLPSHRLQPRCVSLVCGTARNIVLGYLSNTYGTNMFRRIWNSALLFMKPALLMIFQLILSIHWRSFTWVSRGKCFQIVLKKLANPTWIFSSSLLNALLNSFCYGSLQHVTATPSRSRGQGSSRIGECGLVGFSLLHCRQLHGINVIRPIINQTPQHAFLRCRFLVIIRFCWNFHRREEF